MCINQQQQQQQKLHKQNDRFFSRRKFVAHIERLLTTKINAK